MELINYLKSTGQLSDDLPLIAYRAVELCNDNTVVISGSKLGLLSIAEIIVKVALSNNNYDHLHLDDTNYFDKANIEIVIEKK